MKITVKENYTWGDFLLDEKGNVWQIASIQDYPSIGSTLYIAINLKNGVAINYKTDNYSNINEIVDYIRRYYGAVRKVTLEEIIFSD